MASSGVGKQSSSIRRVGCGKKSFIAVMERDTGGAESHSVRLAKKHQMTS